MIMLTLEIKNLGRIDIQNLVLDMNGTITCDGKLIDGIYERIQSLKKLLDIYIISADTFGTAKKIAEQLGVKRIQLNASSRESKQKAAFVDSLNPKMTIVIGNGQNDVRMLKIARIGIGVIGSEGMIADLFSSAKIIVTSPIDALELLLQPKRLIATLRD